MDNRQAFINQTQAVLALADEISQAGDPRNERYGLAVLNGLLSIALVEFAASPVVGQFASRVSLRSAIEPETARAF